MRNEKAPTEIDHPIIMPDHNNLLKKIRLSITEDDQFPNERFFNDFIRRIEGKKVNSGTLFVAWNFARFDAVLGLTNKARDDAKAKIDLYFEPAIKAIVPEEIFKIIMDLRKQPQNKAQ